ncbi:MAG: HNH endonuclease [Candidatus Eisenbacteria bacterium]|uniref:HNH endonuclease n=1 Tax=Eiseniibacteriota bacterium TaxID=2212470 RepID=A0A956RMT7_UNCEI|nr:HNH endonuclease [Candidatus Eisenbacteria bacterium]
MKRPSVPLRVRDQVFVRDGFQCTFVGPEGRCPERRGLEIDHRDPVARGGTDDPANLRVLCRAHNQLMAERAFGAEFMRTRVAGERVP